MRRVWVIVLVALYALAGFLAARSLLSRAPEQPGAPEASAYVIVSVDGREVYRRELNSFTAYGVARFLRYTLDSATSGGCLTLLSVPMYAIRYFSDAVLGITAYQKQPFNFQTTIPHCTLPEPLYMYFIDFVEPMPYHFPPLPNEWSLPEHFPIEYPTNYVGFSAVTVSYGYNSTHFTLSLFGYFSPDENVMLDYVLLAGLVETCTFIQSYGYTCFIERAIVMIEQVGVSVPAGSACSVHIMFVWRDYGGFKDNWGKVLQLAFDPSLQVTLVDTNGNTFDATSPALNASKSFCHTPEPNRMRMVFGTGTSSPSRAEHRMENPVKYIEVHITDYLSVGAVAPIDATEVGLEVMVRDRWVLVFRQVFPQPIKAGTPITIYIVAPSAAP